MTARSYTSGRMLASSLARLRRYPSSRLGTMLRTVLEDDFLRSSIGREISVIVGVLLLEREVGGKAHVSANSHAIVIDLGRRAR